MKLLLIGSGGREHALAWKLAQSPHATRLWCAPGNAGIAGERLAGNGALVECVRVGAEDLPGLLGFAREHRPDLTVVGPDNPLALGIVDLFGQHGLRIWGPNQKAAQFEASKVFAQRFMEQHGIPTARSGIFREAKAARDFAAGLGGRCAVKADGLALGKGVLICSTPAEAERAIDEVLVRRAFGAAGEQIVIQEFLEGVELSLHALCDGKTAKLFPTAQDHKRALDGDGGLNTGGMGAYSPTPFLGEPPFFSSMDWDHELGRNCKLQIGVAEEERGPVHGKGSADIPARPAIPTGGQETTPIRSDAGLAEVGRAVLEPWLRGCAAEGIEFHGVLYPGLMLTAAGPKVLEFNARFGDPETQVYVTRLENDLVELLEASVAGALEGLELKWSSTVSVCVIMASDGYPGNYAKGKLIGGLDEVTGLPNTKVFHAGTTRVGDQVLTNGGRVLGVTAWAKDLPGARAAAYAAVDRIHFEGAHFRRDIGARGVDSTALYFGKGITQLSGK